MESENSIRIDEIIKLYETGSVQSRQAIDRIIELWKDSRSVQPIEKKLKTSKKKSSEQIHGEKKMKADLHDLTEALDKAIPEPKKREPTLLNAIEAFPDKPNKDGRYDETTAKEMLILKKQGMTFADIAEKYQVSGVSVKNWIIRFKPDERNKL